MIKIEKIDTYGWEAAVRGMRNPMNSWDKSDSFWTDEESCGEVKFVIGENDLALMKRLRRGGPDHGKYMRMIGVSMDITAMQPWWMEFDTYKVSTVRNSCSKMHKIHVKEFTMDDFETEGIEQVNYAAFALRQIINICNILREDFNETQDRKYWRALIELLPEGYRMKATVTLNYEVLRNMYHARKNHKLTEWRDFCSAIKNLPYAKELICE